MTIYADVLIFVNTFVNFVMLCCVDLFGKQQPKWWRTVLAALFGGACSLYIFLPDVGWGTELLFRLFCSAGMVSIAYGFGKGRRFLRLLAVLYGVSFLFCGGMIGLWFLFRPPNLVIRNGVVYYHISPGVLVLSTLLCYALVRLLRRLGHRQANTAARVSVRIFYGSNSADFTAIADTGHSLKDLLTGAPVLVAELDAARALLGSTLTAKLLCFAGGGEAAPGLRVIPYRAVGGQGLLPAVRCQKAVFALPGGPKEVYGPVLALCTTPLGEDYNAIFDPEIL